MVATSPRVTTPADPVAAAVVVRPFDRHSRRAPRRRPGPAPLSWSVAPMTRRDWTPAGVRDRGQRPEPSSRCAGDRHGRIGRAVAVPCAGAGPGLPAARSGTGARAGPTTARPATGAPCVRTEAGLLEPARLGRPADHAARRPWALRQAPPPLLRRTFTLRGTGRRGPAVRHRARPARGHDQRPGRSATTVLAPGWTATDTGCAGRHLRRHRPAARRASNVIGADARRRLVPRPARLQARRQTACTYGRELALIAQLEVALADGTTTGSSPTASWSASTGEVRSRRPVRRRASIDLRLSAGRAGRAGLRRRGLAAGRRARPSTPRASSPALAPPVRPVGA